ncbi:ubiquinol-cytochrome C chaperone [Rhizobiaceae bacterium BDR2-2]|uniref:Ubiquinol-cytochrome C chaperone n=1 Tax=Ectorhizobium quercum TaxID=2965071 RepID=A0AAE3N3E9_9HYPH|nr:ubiquinol-cytochrome C chaperone family protein [Ectorhizobium quercum]MCX8998969.1 ubiquinol-cytochrome C chaperone [Ectorhizobium quercum]
MIFGLFSKRNDNREILDRQYGALTAAARQPYFYTDLGVPDTVMGRLEMISLVMILFFRRTRFSGVSGQELAQEIIDAFFQDIDHSIRELGVGDPSVPKRMKKLAGRFYGRLEAYAAALDAGDAPALAAALQRNIHPEVDNPPSMTALAGWAMHAERHLAAATEDAVAAGRVTLPAADAGEKEKD